MRGSEDSDLFQVEWDLKIDKTQLRWESYVKAGYYGVLDRFFAIQSGLNKEWTFDSVTTHIIIDATTFA